MSKIYSYYMKYAFKIVAPSSITAALIFLFNNRRFTEIGFDFLQWELTHNVMWITLLSFFIIILLRVLYEIRKKKTNWGIIFYKIKKVVLFTPLISIILLMSSILAYFAFGLRQNYKYYSEVSYQKEILNHIENARYVEARTAVENYLRMFPQRRNGALRDEICQSVLYFTSGMAVIKRSIKSQNRIRPMIIDGLEIPVLFDTRQQAYELINEMSGGASADDFN